VASAQVKIGSETVSTDGNGDFSIQVSKDEIVDGVGGTVVPIEVTADGYATGYVKMGYFSGMSGHHAEITLLPVSDRITDEDNVTSGVIIRKNGERVGRFSIPSSALPAGVTQITGNITYIDPTTPDINACPGNDLLAVTDGGTNVTLDSLGMMEFDLRDQNGDPITNLNGNAQICMEVPDGITASNDESIPLWWYNPEDGLWHEDGQGTFKESSGLICGNVTHFTWWNYDRPVTTHSCFKFSAVDDETGSSVDLDWYAEGVTFVGGAPERPCDCDGDGTPISSLTVKKSSDDTGVDPEQIKVYALINGVRYYLKDDGDGTFTLMTNGDEAIIFDTPRVQGSCYFNENVENCQPLDGDDGILHVGGINYAPDITSLNVPDNLAPEETAALAAHITDADGDDISVAWFVTCGTIDNQDPAEGVFLSSSFATADFTAPDLQTMEVCKITLTAQDSEGNTSDASSWIWIQGETPLGTIEGTVYGPDGQPLAGVPVVLTEGWQGEFEGDYKRTTITDDNGTYVIWRCSMLPHRGILVVVTIIVMVSRGGSVSISMSAAQYGPKRNKSRISIVAARTPAAMLEMTTTAPLIFTIPRYGELFRELLMMKPDPRNRLFRK